jgi:hypothetical protein
VVLRDDARQRSYIQGGASSLSANPEVASRPDSRFSTSGCRPNRQRGVSRGACSQSLAKHQRWPVRGRRLLLGEGDHAVGLSLTIEIVARESSRAGVRDERFAADADRVDRNPGDRFGDCASRSRASQLTSATAAIRASRSHAWPRRDDRSWTRGGRCHWDSNSEAHAVGLELHDYRSSCQGRLRIDPVAPVEN